MILDLRTIYVVGATTCIILGCIQLFALLTARFERWPLLWGLSSLLLGCGMVLIALRGLVPDFVSIEIANMATWSGYLLLLASVRSFAGMPARTMLYLGAIAGAGVLLFLWNEPEGFARRVMLMSVLCSTCDVLIVREGLRLVRRERLRSAWLLVGLFAPTVVLFLLRGWLALTGQLGSDLFSEKHAPLAWLAIVATAFIIMRSNALMLLATERSRNQLVFLAQHDPLTGAMNRSGLENAISQFSSAGSNRPRRLALLLIDIDHFKSLNDTRGHAAGDGILRLFADTARRELRREDILARHGGDEFTVLLPDLGLPEAMRVAERLRLAFSAAAADLASGGKAPTLSIGVTEGNVASQTFEGLLRDADEALYRSKRMGRDRVQSRINALAS
ncbi:MAG TPA: GGDEF domain-containing protein [Bosea sp. (in: a-proteobacteria)]|uniref:GGDEF domain-containing protein n=1 Tax=Bosea sp. (in: a-proteobacteria) TaxID=1871050 RepID=UPI002E15F6A8|nr:GGDEF domain-containing protein [Bosea sp. (in: a-proteobacteria)]